MRMAELAERSGLPVATIKYYLREGLLPAGLSLSATRAEYDEGHLRRLRLVRALTDVAGLRLDAVRDVLAAVDDDTLSWHAAIGAAHRRLSPAPTTTSERARAQVEDLLTRHGWETDWASGHVAQLAQALDALADLDQPVDDDTLDVLATAAATIAEHDVATVEDEDRVAATERVVLGTLLLEPALVALRRIAQEQVSQRTRD